MATALAMILAGGSSRSLSVLTEVRAEPAIPFGGKFRVIDFVLSNCVNSDIFNVAVLTQYRPRSLNDHVGTGKPWDLDLGSGGVHLLQPYQGGPYGDWQKGTADAVRRNLDFLKTQKEDLVLVLAGDHVYLMDYRPMMRQHARNQADVTVAVRRVSRHETHRFGIVTLDDDRIVRFDEKPRRTPETVASMGVYCFRKDLLIDILEKNDFIDFGRDVMPHLIERKLHVGAYSYSGYWADIGTVQAYWEANMSLLGENPALDLYDSEWVVHTRSEDRAPVRVGPRAQIDGNLLSNGCRVDGLVERSVLSPGVYVAEGAAVRDSIIFHDSVIEAGAMVDRAIVDKDVVIGTGARVGHGEENTANQEMPDWLNTGLTLVGKFCRVPSNAVVGRNVVLHPGAEFGKKRLKVASGACLGELQ
ncbi:MAG: glucose-1-phosphate adenylyltransferase subunit GlgD [Candidatus Eremiobacterota bacterium]